MFWVGLIAVIICSLVIFGPFISGALSRTGSGIIGVNVKRTILWVIGLIIGITLMILG